MTAQMNDNFLYKNKEYTLAAYRESEPYNPNLYGMETIGTGTSCWRGYVCCYSIKNNFLYLKDLYVNLLDDNGKRMDGPIINGQKPIYQGDFKLSDLGPDGMFMFFNNAYKGVNLKLDYSGSLFIADDLDDKLHIHMGFDEAWKYETVYELVFKNGKLLSTHDRSEEMNKLREEKVIVEFDFESFVVDLHHKILMET